MKICGIVAEYNPFHNGHKYHIEQTRRMGATHIVAVMSGNTVQRGEVAVFDKHFRAKKACENGANLVIELPCPYSCANAEVFSLGAMEILKGLGCVEALSFGCETDDKSALLRASECVAALCDSQIVKGYVSNGASYPSAVSKACGEIYGAEVEKIISSPNNTLAVEYIKACKKLNFGVEFIPVKRLGASHDTEEISNKIASASLVRKKAVLGETFTELVPYDTENQEIFSLEKMSKAIIFNLKCKNLDEILAIPDCTKELGVRMYKLLQSETPQTLAQLYDGLKSKNITHARIRRVVLYSILGVCVSDFSISPYARILACDDKGIEILQRVKNNGEILVSHSLSKLSQRDDGAKRLSKLDTISSSLQKMCGNGQKNYPNEFGIKFEKTN